MKYVAVFENNNFWKKWQKKTILSRKKIVKNAL